MDMDINQPLWYSSLIMHLCDVQIHLTLTCKDQSAFMESSHRIANLYSFSDELFIHFFLNTCNASGLQEKQAIFNSIKTSNCFGNCQSSF